MLDFAAGHCRDPQVGRSWLGTYGGHGEGGGVKYSVFSGVLPELSAEEVCARLARHGYDGVEWRVNGEYHWRAATIGRDAPRIKALCAAHGLEVAGLTSYVRPDEDEAVVRLIDACRTLGCPRFRIFSARYDPAARLLRAARSHARPARAPRPPARGQRGQGAARDPFRHDRREPRARVRPAARPRPGDHRGDSRSG